MEWDGTCFRQKLIFALRRRQSQKWEMKNDELEFDEGEDGEDHPFAFGRVQWRRKGKRMQLQLEYAKEKWNESC